MTSLLETELVRGFAVVMTLLAILLRSVLSWAVVSEKRERQQHEGYH